ncbi:MAG: tRNA preQ1(34) S-adenosylmethionine ribosyltransferase-isomerase QueA [Desulfobacteraceae bacterium]
MFNIEDYQFELPEELIAQEPAPDRTGSRLFMVDRENTDFSDHLFRDLPGLLNPGDLLVINDTRVVPARLYGRKESGGRIEVLVLEPEAIGGRFDLPHKCMVKASKRLRRGARLFLEQDVLGTVEEAGPDGTAWIRFSGPRDLEEILEEEGSMPLPPYIKRSPGDPRGTLDKERYQTVYARRRGAVAAPTAGLHFSEELMERLKEAGINLSSVTLHVGYGTFKPVRTRDIREHSVGEEAYTVPEETAAAVERTRNTGGRVVAVGTTVVRTLETAADETGRITPGQGRTGLMITPGYRFRVVEAMITNFHLPKSSLLFLTAAFAGRDLILRAYGRAVKERYRFFSYGDAMLIV